MDTNTITTCLINRTTATINANQSFSTTYPKNKTGLSNTYSVLGLIVSIETTRERGWLVYETDIRVSYKGHWGTPDGFSEWFSEYRNIFTENKKQFTINRTYFDRHSATRFQEAHDIGVIAGELHVLTIINKYVELLFNNVEAEVITRQINELTSQLATLTTTN